MNHIRVHTKSDRCRLAERATGKETNRCQIPVDAHGPQIRAEVAADRMRVGYGCQPLRVPARGRLDLRQIAVSHKDIDLTVFQLQREFLIERADRADIGDRIIEPLRACIARALVKLSVKAELAIRYSARRRGTQRTEGPMGIRNRLVFDPQAHNGVGIEIVQPSQ